MLDVSLRQLVDGQPKSIEPMGGRLAAIEHPEKDYVQALSQVIKPSSWEDPLIRQSMRRRIGRIFGNGGVRINDHTGFVSVRPPQPRLHAVLASSPWTNLFS